MRARLIVEQTGPLTTVQDLGRPGLMRFGVPRSGPVDRLAFASARTALGAPDSAGIEFSLGGISLRCLEGEVAFALTGGDFQASLDGAPPCAWGSGMLGPGARLVIREGQDGNWGYLAFAGQLTADLWLGSAATHAQAGLGGGRVALGQVLEVEDVFVPRGLGPIARPPFEQDRDSVARVVLGPQERFFDEEALSALVTLPFRASASFDRMGMALDGPALAPRALDMLSEPLVRGSVQVNGAGIASLLFADHQTTGGYPKIATVIGADIDRIAQLRFGRELRFDSVTPAAAVEDCRIYLRQVAEYLASLGTRTTLQDRLMQSNLISGVAGTDLS